MEWIKCEYRMPENKQKVLFYVENRKEIFAGHFLSTDNKFRENLDEWWFEDEIISHWMPLPEDPKNK